jgi:hypothetical protein
MVGTTATHEHARRIHRELVQAGATVYGLLKSESRYLPHVIHEDEHIHGVVYGQHHSSSAMLVATDRRILYLDKKPMVTLIDEVTYDVVSGIELDIHTIFATVRLHTAVTNYEIRYANIHCADRFTSFIEQQRVDKLALSELNQESPTKAHQPMNLSSRRPPVNDLAGYYWIPDEDKEVELKIAH